MKVVQQRRSKTVRKRYRKPDLTCYGDMVELTRWHVEGDTLSSGDVGVRGPNSSDVGPGAPDTWGKPKP